MLGASVCIIACQARAAESTTQPADPPADTQPFIPDNISEAAIELTHRQKAALSAVRDGKDYRESAFFMMLARVEELVDAKAASEEYSSLESPAVGHLTKYPNRYRAQKLRIGMRVFSMREFVSGAEGWDACTDWPRGKKVWYMSGWHVSENGKGSKNLVAYSLVDPTELLGKPSSVKSDGEKFYNNPGKLLKLAAVYYKTFRHKTIDSTASNPRFMDYPLVLAYHLESSSPTRPKDLPTTSFSFVDYILVPIILLALALFVVRRQSKRAKNTPIGSGRAGNVKYTPLRNVEKDDLPPDERNEEPVDQALVDAVKAFENKSKESDGTDDKS